MFGLQDFTDGADVNLKTEIALDVAKACKWIIFFELNDVNLQLE